MFYIGTSFKMNKTRAEARAYAAHLSGSRLPDKDQVQLFVIPPFTAIESFAEAARGLPIWIGAQNCGPAASGAYTGEVSAGMIAELGCQLVELGHSERRAMFGDTDQMIARKVRQVVNAGLRPLICLGETAAERQAGLARETVLQQADAALSELAASEHDRCLLAYEPVWAIGIHGTPATVADVAPVHDLLKSRFSGLPVLYGGSVDTGNAAELATEPLIDGLFVGRAALDPAMFISIIDRAMNARFQPSRAS